MWAPRTPRRERGLPSRPARRPGPAEPDRAGFDAVEIMGAEGYLLNQFTSPLTNRRTDGWGGDSDRRGRFGVQVVRAVRRALGAGFPIVFRFSADDLMAGSSTWQDNVGYARR